MSNAQDVKFRRVFAECFVVPDSAGQPRVIIDQRGVTLASKSGNTRASMLFNPDTDDPEFVICEEDGNVRANFLIDQVGIPRLIIRDRLGEPRVLLTFDENLPSQLLLFDGNGHPIYQVP